MNEKHLTAFLISFVILFVLHFLLEETWEPNEPRPRSMRILLNYSIGTAVIYLSFIYQRPDAWLELLVSIAGAGSATMLAHRIDWVRFLDKTKKAHDIVDEINNQANTCGKGHYGPLEEPERTA